MMKDVLEVHKIYIRFTSWKQTCYFSMAVLLQEYLVCLEREDVGFGLSEDNIKRFNVGEAVYGPGLLHGLVGNWLTIDKSQTFWIITVSTNSQYSLTENEKKKKPKSRFGSARKSRWCGLCWQITSGKRQSTEGIEAPKPGCGDRCLQGPRKVFFSKRVFRGRLKMQDLTKTDHK